MRPERSRSRGAKGASDARAHPTDGQPTLTGSAALSLVELRRHLLRRAGELTARARTAKARGDGQTAARLEAQAHSVNRAAHRIDAR